MRNSEIKSVKNLKKDLKVIMFKDCYHELVSLENASSLTGEHTALLTDLDELEDYWVHKK